MSVVAEIVWFFLQGRLLGLLPMPRWLLVCGARGGAAHGHHGRLRRNGCWALVVAQALHALTFASPPHRLHRDGHRATFPGRLRGRGQALFTVIGYGFGGVLGVLVGGAIAQRFGYVAMFSVATAVAAVASGCAWRAQRVGGAV